ncbi:DUF1516 family protein [Alkalicoccobacillus gibsonii]|uniref:DUF1516 family protein n=1 Tax=Alkalicoccobacillus gibsonii TaxID=79881 RepID=A0ABU9VRE1_9BACI
MYDILYQVHIGTWIFLLVSIGLNLFYHSSVFKILFRLMSIVMLGSGIALAYEWSFPLVFILKLVLALLLIGLTEMLLKKENPKEQTVLLLCVSGLFLILVLIGFGIIRF